MLLAGRFEAHFAFPVEPCVPVPGVHLQDRLKFSAATIDAALHEGHGASSFAMTEPSSLHFTLGKAIAPCAGLDNKSLLDQRDRAGFVVDSQSCGPGSRRRKHPELRRTS